MKRYCLTNYAVRCTDAASGEKGCFLFDQQHWIETGKFKAVSPVFPDLQSFYDHTTPDERKAIFIERNGN